MQQYRSSKTKPELLDVFGILARADPRGNMARNRFHYRNDDCVSELFVRTGVRDRNSKRNLACRTP
jgi:hypothetical protein